MEDKSKLQEEIIKSEVKSLEKIWKNVDEDYSLSALLDKMTKDELVKVSRKYSVKGITTLKKADAVEKVKNVVLEKYIDILNIIEENTFKFTKELSNTNGLRKYECNDLIYTNYLRNRGLAFTGAINGELYVILPEELKDLLEKNLTKEVKESSKLNYEIIRVIAGMAYYYGVIPLEYLKSVINTLFNLSIEEDLLETLINDGEELGYDYVVNDKYICHIDVEDKEMILNQQSENEVGYCKFDKKTLIKAGNPDFIEENKQKVKLETVMGELFVIDKNILKEEMDGFIFAIKNEMPMDEAINNFLEAYEIQSDEERNIFTYELQLFAKSISRWTLKGYSQNEVEKINQRVVNEVRIGRNDPCICGSNKKFKKCCGR